MKESWEQFRRGLWEENPVFVHLLGMCPVLAVSNTFFNSLAMGLATTFVLICSAFLVSLLRNLIPKEVRIAAFILIIATFVTLVDYVIQAISLDLYKSLGAFISLIVVNCMILGRAEAFASRNSVLPSLLDASGTGIGFTFAICCMGSFREILGMGSFAGISLFGESFQPWTVMILPGGGFFVLGGLLIFLGWLTARKEVEVLT